MIFEFSPWKNPGNGKFEPKILSNIIICSRDYNYIIILFQIKD